MKIKSWKVSPKAGSFDNLLVVEDTLLDPNSNEVQIEIKSFGLNFADIFAIFGLYSATPKGSFIPGLEYSGVVSKVGSEVVEFKVGDRVMGVSRFGGYTSGINQNPDYITKIPDDWSFEMGASYLVQVLTAYYGLVDLGNIDRLTNPTVLIHSAAGGVGIWANRIAKYYNAFTIGTVGNDSKLSNLTEEGYNKGIVRSKNFGPDLKESLEGRELNIVMECIGGEILMESYKQMASEGRLISYGNARYAHPGSKPKKIKLLIEYFTSPKLDPQKMIAQNKGVFGFNLIYLFDKSERMKRYLKYLEEINPGKPVVGNVFIFEELKDALNLFLSGKTTGKVVINI